MSKEIFNEKKRLLCSDKCFVLRQNTGEMACLECAQEDKWTTRSMLLNVELEKNVEDCVDR